MPGLRGNVITESHSVPDSILISISGPEVICVIHPGTDKEGHGRVSSGVYINQAPAACPAASSLFSLPLAIPFSTSLSFQVVPSGHSFFNFFTFSEDPTLYHSLLSFTA